MRKGRLKLLAKYIMSSRSCSAVDFILFILLQKLLTPYLAVEAVLVSTILARIVSSLCNYFINSRYVFKVWHKDSIIKYYVMVIVQMFVSAFSVYILRKFIVDIPAAFIKMGVDFIIFVVNYIIQKKRIFVGYEKSCRFCSGRTFYNL